MRDIFDAKIMCRRCNLEMNPVTIEKKGFKLRAVECANCGEQIIHPADLNSFEHYIQLKQKTFNVKFRIVGNSHAISIPKEIVDFMNEMSREMDIKMNEMFKLYFEDFGKLSIKFIDETEFNKVFNRRNQLNNASDWKMEK